MGYEKNSEEVYGGGGLMSMKHKCKLHILRDSVEAGLCSRCIDRIVLLKEQGVLDKNISIEESIKILEQRRETILEIMRLV